MGLNGKGYVMIRRYTTLGEFILKKANKAPDGPYYLAMQHLQNAVIAGRMPTFDGKRPSSRTWRLYFQLVPEQLRPQAAKVWKNYQKLRQYERAEMEWQRRAATRPTRLAV